MSQNPDLLTDKEKETLRLMVRGHDAKSMASELALSVHTINERLRSARRKLDVTSSREAARILYESEGGTYENLADKELGEELAAGLGDKQRIGRTRAWLIGVIVMSMLAAALLIFSPLASDSAGPPDAETAARDAAVEAAARDWLEFGDARDWQAGFNAAGDSFRAANTVAGFREASEQVRVPLGAVVSRTLATIRYLNAPPHGFQEVTFHTQFANKADAVETVTLVKEGGQWKVVGILID
ncbi:MAG: LuxR family transcriptional regulator [Citromicrobium sp.]|nr:MAG: LuxR family transcriptional regulator [Citromicrobium sp.]